MLLKEKLG